MSPENLPAGHESEELSASLLLQESLGVDADVARDLASVQVECPVPGEDRQSSLGEFMTSPHGADKAEQIVDIARQAVQNGAEPEEAIGQALGFAALRDKQTGKLLRVNEQPETNDPPADEVTEKDRNDEDLAKSLRETAAQHASDETITRPDQELPPEERAALHEDPDAEPAGPEPAAAAEERSAELPPQPIDEAVTREHERDQVMVDTSSVLTEASEPASVPETPAAENLVVTKIQKPESAVATPAPAPLKNQEKPAPIIIAQPVESAPVKSDQDFQPFVANQSAANPGIEISDQTLATPAQPAEETRPLAEAEVSQSETPAQKLVLNLEAILPSDTAGTEIAEKPIAISEALMTPAAIDIATQVGEALKEPAVLENPPIKLALEDVTRAMENVQLLQANSQGLENLADAEQQLVVACEKLLDGLGIAYEKEAAEEFARLVMAAQTIDQAPERQAPAEELSREDEGTHEFKPDDFGVANLLLQAQQKFWPLRALGKWAVAGSLTG